MAVPNCRVVLDWGVKIHHSKIGEDGGQWGATAVNRIKSSALSSAQFNYSVLCPQNDHDLDCGKLNSKG